jgi:hypothetical protein
MRRDRYTRELGVMHRMTLTSAEQQTVVVLLCKDEGSMEMRNTLVGC